MADLKTQYIGFDELCEVTELSSQVIIKIVKHGIVEPPGNEPENWVFSTEMVAVTKKAYRLHRDLEIDWSGIALAINLLEELERLKLENQQLHCRLQRFIADST